MPILIKSDFSYLDLFTCVFLNIIILFYKINQLAVVVTI